MRENRRLRSEVARLGEVALLAERGSRAKVRAAKGEVGEMRALLSQSEQRMHALELERDDLKALVAQLRNAVSTDVEALHVRMGPEPCRACRGVCTCYSRSPHPSRARNTNCNCAWWRYRGAKPR